MTNLLIITILLKLSIIDCIWPPGYRINLQDNEDFIISDLFPNDDDDEMIPISQINDDRFYKIHQFADRYNNKKIINKTNKKQFNKIINESNFDVEEDPTGWQAGYVDENGNFQNDDDDDDDERKIDVKREEILKIENITQIGQQNIDYDYKNFDKQYNDEIKNELNVKLTTIKDEESPGDVVDEIVDFKQPKNCTAEELKGIGFNALRCLTKDLKQSNNRRKLLKRLLTITTIWFCCYLTIAIPCWCYRGWCCCCLSWCLKCCRPHEQLNEARHFYMNNPLGTYQINDNDKIIYQPTIYEETMQKRLEKALLKL